MEYKEFLRHLGKAGLTNRQFAALIKIHPASVSNFKAAGVPSQVAIIAVLMGELADHQIDFIKAVSNIAMEPKKPRGPGFKKKLSLED